MRGRYLHQGLLVLQVILLVVVLGEREDRDGQDLRRDLRRMGDGSANRRAVAQCAG